MKRILIVALLASGAAGCAKRADVGPDGSPRIFNPKGVDATLDLSRRFEPLRPGRLRPTTSVQSESWLGLSNQLYEWAYLTQNPEVMVWAKSLSESFYALPHATSKMIKTATPYAALAFHALKERTADKKVADLIKDAVSKAAEETNINHAALTPSKNPATVVRAVLDAVYDFMAKLESKKGPETAEHIAGIIDLIKEKHIPGLKEMERVVVREPGLPVVPFMERLKDTLKKIPALTEGERNALTNELRFGIYLSMESSALDDAEKSLGLIIDIWLNGYRRNLFPADLKEALGQFSDQELLALATQNQVLPEDEWKVVRNTKVLKSLTQRQIVARGVENQVIMDSDEWLKVLVKSDRHLKKLLERKDVMQLASDMVPEEVLSSQQVLTVLASMWLGQELRLVFPETLRKSFADLSRQDLEMLKTNDFWTIRHPWLRLIRRQAIADLKMFTAEGLPAPENPQQALENLKAYLEQAIVGSAQERVTFAFIPIAKNLPKVIKSNIDPLLATQARGLTVDKFKSTADEVLEEWFFAHVKGEKSLPLLEKSEVRFESAGNDLRNIATPNTTQPAVLGKGFTNISFRLHQGGVSSVERALGYQNVCKMSVMMGYKDLGDRNIEPLIVNLERRGQKLVLGEYNPANGLFAIPDRLIFRDSAELDEQTYSQLQVSAEQQMELLRGLVSVIRFVSPWRQSPFDQQLGTLRIKQIPFEVFSKPTLFKMAVGLSEVIFQNMKSHMVRVVDENLGLWMVDEKTDPNGPKRVGAVVTDLVSLVKNNSVSSGDLARALLAMTEFYEATLGIESVTDPKLQSIVKSVVESRPEIKKLIMGLALFLSNQMVLVDGGVASEFDFNSKLPSRIPRKLSDQLITATALLKLGNLFQTDLFRLRAVDVYYFMNRQLWSGVLGFYKQVEGDDTLRVKLEDVATALSLVNRLQGFIQSFLTQSPMASESLSQLRRLESLWTERFMDRQWATLPPIQQVMEFSL
ncbi:MAG: hypothetical protein IT289_05740 [Oligoflexia bacterium]|nr:hypothetical protein [Oligoflexia bacterium]